MIATMVLIPVSYLADALRFVRAPDGWYLQVYALAQVSDVSCLEYTYIPILYIHTYIYIHTNVHMCMNG